jgi:acyl-coenzyme A synthetase/AMP-(fatty) acid ligase
MRAGSTARAEEIIESTRDVLSFEKPRSLRIVEELPRNAYGKVVKAELRELVAAGAGPA